MDTDEDKGFYPRSSAFIGGKIVLEEFLNILLPSAIFGRSG